MDVPKPKPHNIYTTLLPVLFATKCQGPCNKYKRFEKMFQWETGPWHGRVGRWRYMCFKCAKDESEVEKIWDEKLKKRRDNLYPVTPLKRNK